MLGDVVRRGLSRRARLSGNGAEQKSNQGVFGCCSSEREFLKVPRCSCFSKLARPPSWCRLICVETGAGSEAVWEWGVCNLWLLCCLWGSCCFCGSHFLNAILQRFFLKETPYSFCLAHWDFLLAQKAGKESERESLPGKLSFATACLCSFLVRFRGLCSVDGGGRETGAAEIGLENYGFKSFARLLENWE